MTSSGLRQVNIRLPDDLLHRVDITAAQLRLSRYEAVALLLEEGLKANGKAPKVEVRS